MDKDRSAFGMKESRLADYYCEVLGLAKNSHDAFVLKGWEHQSKTAKSDFADAAYEVLKSRLTEKSKNSTIEAVNKLLDELNQSPDKKEVFGRIVFGTSAEEQKWIIRIILKDVRIGLGSTMILKCIHPDAQDLFNMTSSLKKICEELRDPSKRIQQASLELFCPFVPMLANRADINETMTLMMGRAIIEPKLDGERMQLHYDKKLGIYRYWSRRGTEYTYLYGRDSQEGSLTPKISFPANVDSIILDGEMLAYDPITKDFLPFGTLKSSSSTMASERKLHDPHPCFVVFDLVFLNGQSLIDKPLEERKALLLDANIDSIEGYLQIIEGITIESQEELVEQMDQALANKLEGLIVKLPTSKYSVGRRLNDWIKLKPDYVDSLCDDLDLLIVGGSFGRGVGGVPGAISSFTCALRNADQPGNFKALCRVGSGIPIGELDRLRARLGDHFVPFDVKHIPPWLEVNTGLPDRPDLIISRPSNSIIIQVKATQIVESKVYPVGLTLRHPRYIREREDRSWDSTMTVKELQDMYKIEKGSLAKRSLSVHLTSNPADKAKRTKVLRGKWSAAKLAAQFAAIDANKVKASADILGGLEFHVVNGEDRFAADGSQGLDKMDLEKRCLEMGGSITQAPQPGRTFCALAGQDEGLRLSNLKRQGTIDIVKSSWLHDSLQARFPLPLQPKYMIFATEQTRKKLAELTDPFGDSYIEEISTDGLKGILLRPVWPVKEQSKGGNDKLVAEIKQRYMADL